MAADHVPIRRELMVMMLLVCGVVMLLMQSAFFTYELLGFRRAAVLELSSVARILASNSTAALAFDNPDDAREILSSVKGEAHLVAAALYDGGGKLFATYPDTVSAGSLPSAPRAEPFAISGARLAGFQPVLRNNVRLGTLYLECDWGPAFRQWLVSFVEIALAVIVVTLTAAYILSNKLQRQISEPILQLAETARAVSERGDFSVRAREQGLAEVEMLTGAFNRMLDQLQSLNATLEQRVVERTAQLESANKELEAFSYSVSHDLRAPLRHIDGFAQLLGQRMAGRLDETEQRYLSTVTASAKRLGLLIDELLVFCRMGRSEMARGTVDTGALVQLVVKDLQMETAGRKIEWRIGELPEVHGDPSMLRQVWSNLIGNAVKYSRKREEAVIEISHRIDGGDGHVFSVRDNGAGFEMQYASKLFGVFQRLHVAADFEGTGIGLANVRRIVERHGGRTWAEGKVGEGAVFYFSLPSNPPAGAKP